MDESFRLSDPLQTEQTSLKDLFSHRTGVPGIDIPVLVGLTAGTTLAQAVRWVIHDNYTKS